MTFLLSEPPTSTCLTTAATAAAPVSWTPTAPAAATTAQSWPTLPTTAATTCTLRPTPAPTATSATTTRRHRRRQHLRLRGVRVLSIDTSRTCPMSSRPEPKVQPEGERVRI